VVTRAEHQAEGLTRRLRAEGAEVELLPLLAVLPPADPAPLAHAAAELSAYDWVAFTSANAVEAFLPLAPAGLPAALRGAAVGSATAAALRSFGVEPALQAERGDAEGLAAVLAPRVGAGSRILLPQAADARPTLADALRRAGAEVTAVVAYDKRLPAIAASRAEALFAGRPLGWVTFTSPRIARHFAELFGPRWPERRPELEAASIGRVTTAELRDLGVERIAEAATPDDAALVRAIAAATSPR
jgi:uroporphyrinogen-III synthase